MDMRSVSMKDASLSRASARKSQLEFGLSGCEIYTLMSFFDWFFTLFFKSSG